MVKGIKRLGRTSAAQRAHDKYLTHIKTKADNDDEANPLLTSVENSDVSGMESNGKYRFGVYSQNIILYLKFLREFLTSKFTII